MLKVIVLSSPTEVDFWRGKFAPLGELIELKFVTEIPKNQKYDLIVIDFSGQPNAKDILQSISSNFIGKHIVVASDSKDADLAIESIKLGAIGFLVKPFQEAEFKPTFLKIEELAKKKNESGERSGKIITVFSYKGGTGVSTAAVNIGFALGNIFGKKTLLIDGAGFSNHLTVLLNSPPKCTLADLSQQANLDENYLNHAIKMITPTLGIVGGLMKTEDIGIVRIDSVKKLLEVASEMFDYIVIDTAPHSVDEMNMTFLTSADEIVLMTTFDLLSVKDTRFFIQALKDMGIESEKIKPIINRQDWFIGSLEPEIVHKQLNHSVYHALPNDWNLCVESLNYGRPILDFAPDSQLAMSYKLLASNLAGLQIPTSVKKNSENIDLKNQQNKSLFGWFNNK